MITKINDQLLDSLEDGDSKYSALGKLVELGRQQGFVSYDDILGHFPDAEQDVSQLEEVFAANAALPKKIVWQISIQRTFSVYISKMLHTFLC
jgi:hypothetical protein